MKQNVQLTKWLKKLKPNRKIKETVVDQDGEKTG